MTTELEKTALEKIQDHKEQIKLLEKKAVDELKLAKKKLEDEIKSSTITLQANLKKIEKQLADLGHAIGDAVIEKRTRQQFPKISDAEIITKLDKFLGMVKESNAVDIVKNIGISRPRFLKFADSSTYLKTNGETGKKKRYLINK